MHCPVCGYKSTRVIDSRLSTDFMSIRRRRECEKARCGYRFSTVEEIEMLDITVVKRNGRREAYSREKLDLGLKKSLEKRPYTEAQFRTLLLSVERDIQKRRGSDITSRDIGDIVMERLREFDKVAYIRFASVYYSFDDLQTFEDELKKFGMGKRRK